MASNDLIIDMQKNCFLCLNQLDHSLSPEFSKSSLRYSLHHLSKLVKRDSTKIFNGNGAIPNNLVQKLTNGRIMVELCGSCATWNKSFSEKCQQLEKIRMELVTKLNDLQKVMEVGNDDNADRLNKTIYTGGQNSKDDLDLRDKLDIGSMLRNHVMQKCAYMLRTDCPRVKIRKLVASELPPRSKIYPSSTPIIKLDYDKFEQNKEDSDGCKVDDYMDYLETSGKSYSTQEADSEIEIDIKPHVFTQAPQISKPKGALKFSAPALIRTAAGRHKCSICCQQFSNPRSFYSHARSVHLHVRFKCGSCNAEFTRRNTLRKHHESFHLSNKTPNCKFSSKSKSFSSSRNIKRECIIDNEVVTATPAIAEPNIFNETEEDPTSSSPQTSSRISENFKIRYSCPLCPKQFLLRSSYNDHYKNAHIGLRYRCTAAACNKTFSRMAHLSKHQRTSCGRIHPSRGTPTCHCPLCGTGLVFKRNLHKHLMSVHKKMKDVACTRCGDMFYLESELKEHQCKLGRVVVITPSTV